MLGRKKILWHERINDLKMDCDGCEYALAQDILREDRSELLLVYKSRKGVDASGRRTDCGKLASFYIATRKRVNFVRDDNCLAWITTKTVTFTRSVIVSEK